MTEISQYNAIRSAEQALLPAPGLIDGRTEIDRLSFLADFASLINFYNYNNTIEGNWSPFLLKDPVMLVASIAKTRYDAYYSLYQNTCINLQRLLALRDQSTTVIYTAKDLAAPVNQLFDQLNEIFKIIESWTYFMQLYAGSYDLKNYVLQQVRTTFSPVFLSLFYMREYLFLSKVIAGINAPHKMIFQATNSVWLEVKDNRPFWQVLDDTGSDTNPLQKEPGETTQPPGPVKPKDHLQLCFDILKRTGKIVFDFLNTIIVNSREEYERIRFEKNKYPDTTLIRAFVYLLNTQQEQLNSISKKHLSFYYRDILKQTALPAKPDSVFICTQLAKPGEAFNLPKNTLFNAGVDTQNEPVLFSSLAETSLNPAMIVSALTLSGVNDPLQNLTRRDEQLSSLYLNAITNTNVIKKDETGNILGWETFGGSVNSPAQKVNTGIAFASPMFYLPEGKRRLQLSLQFSEGWGSASLQNLLYSPDTAYYLSTQNGWHRVQLRSCPILPLLPPYENMVAIAFELDVTAPAIEKFLVNPDGPDADWPMLKIIFTANTGSQKTPQLESVKIDVSVEGLRSFVLLNDNGPISTTAPFPIFGTIPLLNSNFIMGSNEIFSKPVYDLKIELDWDNLPANFQDYYQQYNDNLPQPPPQITEAAAAEDIPANVADTNTGTKPFFLNRLFRGFITFFKKIFHRQPVNEGTPGINDMPGKEINDPEPGENTMPFNNCCFRIDFKLLKNGKWDSFFMAGPYDPLDANEINVCGLPENYPDNYLFRLDAGADAPAGTSSFFIHTYPTGPFIEREPDPIIKPDPLLQNAPLNYTGDNLSGFFKMELKSPQEGFGSSVYPKIVADIAMQNALIIMIQGARKDQLLQPPNAPFLPLVNTFSANYRACISHNFISEMFNFTETLTGYPLQCFYYSPFTNYKFYDNSATAGFNNKNAVNTIVGPSTNKKGIAFYPSFNYEGALFIELAQLVPLNTLNLYFQLARNTGNIKDKPVPDFYYLGETAWKPLPVLNDGTSNFSCPGIIEFNIPADIAGNTPYMKGDNCWISMAVNNSGNSSNSLSSYSKTIYLDINGIKLQRSGTSFLTGPQVPFLKSNTITKTQTAIPRLATIVQPFASFNGKAAENELAMNRRVSNRIKTKNRALCAEDYYRLINIEFNNIYFSKVFYEPENKCTRVCLVRSIAGKDAPGAFTPYVTECDEIAVQDFLKQKVSPFANVTVSNFYFEKLKIKASVKIKAGFMDLAVEETVNQSLKVYLSPWIAGISEQIKIYGSISAAQVAKFISGLKGVEAVNSIEFYTWAKGKYIRPGDQVSIRPNHKHNIFISAEKHCINCKETISE